MATGDGGATQRVLRTDSRRSRQVGGEIVKVDEAIEEVEKAEAKLAKELRVTGGRHAVEHDLYHLGHTLADGCSQRLERLAPFAERYGAGRRGARTRSPGPIEALPHKAPSSSGARSSRACCFSAT